MNSKIDHNLILDLILENENVPIPITFDLFFSINLLLV